MANIEREKYDIYPFIDPQHGLKDGAKGKSVIVTGGGKGIGKAIALAFAQAGAKLVVIVGRTKSALDGAKAEIEEQSSGTEIRPIVVDLTDPNAVGSLFNDQVPVPDVLVNNAGQGQSMLKVAESDIDTWWQDFDLNVKVPYILSRAYLKALDGKPGVILNVSSAAAYAVGPGASAYGASKTAINRLSEFLHLEYAQQGLQCISFHPGGIPDTDMGRQAPPQYRQLLFDTLMLAAGTTVYLSMPRANFLSGRFVYSNWDMEKLEARKDEITKSDTFKTRLQVPDWVDASLKFPPGVTPPPWFPMPKKAD